MIKKIGLVVLWLITIHLVLTMAAAALPKFDPASSWSHKFVAWHYPPWLRIAVGIAEIAGGLLIVWPRSAWAGALLIAPIMIGAMVTLAVRDHGSHIVIPAIMFAESIIVFVVRRPQFLRGPTVVRYPAVG